jgi:signal transduction histidine kinase
MEERIGLLDGTLTIRSEPGKGTRIGVHVPIPAG